MKFPTFQEEKKLWRKGFKRLAGLDEAGRGPLAGPVTAAAVTIRPAKLKIKNLKLKIILKEIKDSKKLSQKKREKLYKLITENQNIKWGIGRVSEKVIDKINIKNAAELAMEKALKKLRCKPDFLIIDGNHIKNRKLKSINYKLIVKGDEKVFSCACASVPYGTELYLLFKNSQLVRKSIGSLYNQGNLKEYKVFSVDPKNYKIGAFPITGIIRHPPKEIWTLITKLRKKIQVTPDHSLFTLKESRINPIKTSELKRGDYIAIGKTIPFTGKSKINIDLIKILKNQATKQRPIIIEGKLVKKIIEENEVFIKERLIKEGYSRWDFYSWRRRSQLPMNLLPPNYNGKKLSEATLKAGYSSPYKFPPLFLLSKDFFWLLGFYVAEGSKYPTVSKRRKYSVVFTTKDKFLQEKVIKILKKIGITPRINRINIEAGSLLLNYLFTYLGVGDNAPNKRIPNIVFAASKSYRNAFLEGYIAGDGWKDKDNLKSSTVSMRSTSQNLIKDLELLYLSLAKNVSIYEKPYNGQPILLPQGTYANNVSDCWDTRVLSKNAVNTIFGIPIKGIQEELQERMKKTNLNMQKIRDITGFDLWSSINRAKTITFPSLRKINKLFQSKKINKLLESNLAWDETTEIKKDKKLQDVYDIEVRPKGKIIENFIGEGGVIYHNSVIAKVTRDRIMLRYHKKYPRYRFDLHKGYPTRLHKKLLKKYGPCKIHRKSFRPVKTCKQK